jgi:hypothetical protein
MGNQLNVHEPGAGPSSCALFVPGSAAAPKTRRMIDALSAWFAAQSGRF